MCCKCHFALQKLVPTGCLRGRETYEIFKHLEPTEPEFQATLTLQGVFLQSELLQLLLFTQTCSILYQYTVSLYGREFVYLLMGSVSDPAGWWCTAGCPSWFPGQLWHDPLLPQVSDKTLPGQTPVNSIQVSLMCLPDWPQSRKQQKQAFNLHEQYKSKANVVLTFSFSSKRIQVQSLLIYCQ